MAEATDLCRRTRVVVLRTRLFAANGFVAPGLARRFTIFIAQPHDLAIVQTNPGESSRAYRGLSSGQVPAIVSANQEQNPGNSTSSAAFGFMKISFRQPAFDAQAHHSSELY